MSRRRRKHHLPAFDKSGVLLVNKPLEWSSFDVVNCIRGKFNISKVGHCGTLDPMATGLIVLVLNKFTKLSQILSGDDKTYRAELLLGQKSSTLDLEGDIIEDNDISKLSEKEVIEAVNSFLGEYDQIPPMASALKKDGKRLYELARKGIEVEREARRVNIKDINIIEVNLPKVIFDVTCSKGTYIRSLCADIGDKLKCGGLMSALKRTASGDFLLEDSFEVFDIKENWDQETLADNVENLLKKYAKIVEIAKNGK